MISFKKNGAAFAAEADRVLAAIDTEISARLDEVGRKAVEIAKETGSYHDVTGRLRRSNGYKVEGRNLIIYNSAPYAEDVEARGKIVLTTAVLEAEKMLNENADDFRDR